MTQAQFRNLTNNWKESICFMEVRNMEKIVAGYIRVSTEMQVERDSLTNQEETITSFAR